MTATSATTAATTEPTRAKLRTIIGLVTGAKTAKTVKVSVVYQTRHPKYGKYLKRTTVYHVHDEQGAAGEGDTVEIAECRPMSKTKHHRLLRVITKAPQKIATVLDDEQK